MTLALPQASSALRHPVMRFAGVGLINTLVTLAVIFGLKALFAVPDASANLAGYAAGLGCSFHLNRRWTFRHAAAALPALCRFLLVFGAAYALNLIAVLALIGSGLNDYLAHLAGMPLYTVAFYYGCRRFAFADRPDIGRIAIGGRRAAGWYLGMLAVLTLVLFYRLGASPLMVWDEARLANNALEMAQSGLSLVTTYDGLPDHWNTKPPLLIWLMAVSIRLLGANEWAVRLPSVAAAFATAHLVFWFCAGHLKRPFAGFAAALVLLSTAGYVMVHGARAGDYDAMLTLWTSGYLLAGYLLVHADKARRPLWLFLCALCIALAFMTKTIQGLIFLPAVFGYIWWQGRLPGLLRLPSFYCYLAMLLAAGVGYYLAREQLDPGYFAAARSNDLGVRYTTVIEEHRGGLFWYLKQFKLFPWLIPGLVASVIAVWRGSGDARRASLYIGLVSLFYLAVVSCASTKLPWYAIPLCPLLAILLGILCDQVRTTLLDRFQTRVPALGRILIGGCVLAAIAVATLNLVRLEHGIQYNQADELNRLNLLLKNTAAASAPGGHLIVLHPGYPNSQGDRFYVAPTIFYVNLLRAAGHSVEIQPVSAQVPAAASSLAVCRSQLSDKTLRSVTLEPVMTAGVCGIYRITGQRRAQAGAPP